MTAKVIATDPTVGLSCSR